MADNMIIASCNINIKEGQLLSLNLVLSEVKLAQRHLEQIPQDYKYQSAAAYHVDTSGSTEEGDGDLDNDPAALQAHIAKKQLAQAAHLRKEAGAAVHPHVADAADGAAVDAVEAVAADAEAVRAVPLAQDTRFRVHPGNLPEDECWHHDLTAEQANINALEKKLADASAKVKDREARCQHEKAQYVANKTDDLYTVSFVCWDPSQDIPSDTYSTICLNVTQNREYLKGAAIDSARPIDIQNEEELAQLTCCPNVFLEGIIPRSMEVPAATCSFPTIDVYGRPVVLKTQRKGILHKKATSKVI
eukprot:250835-Rhodomonas_salina.1